ncbi:acyl carrier protein [Bacillus sp. FJAT-26377]|nr:acyl carrier protein [Bacillus sp. FJAT-26377]
MSKDMILKIIKENVREISPDIQIEEIDMKESLKNLELNSIDRMEVIINTMEAINTKISFVEIGKVENIGQLVDLFYYNKVNG